MSRPTTSTVRRTAPSRGWPVPLALIALSAIPLAAGAFRLIQLGGGPAVLPADERFEGFPAALVAHIVGAAVYALVGVFQFVPRFRRQHPVWHRRAGRPVRRRPTGRRVGVVAHPLLRPSATDRRPAVPPASAVRIGDGRLPGPRLLRDPPPRRHRPPGLDDARLRDRPRRRHTGVHRGHRHRAVRQWADPGRHRQGDRLGRQSRGRRVGDPPVGWTTALRTATDRSTSGRQCCRPATPSGEPVVRSTPAPAVPAATASAAYRIRVDGHLDGR